MLVLSKASRLAGLLPCPHANSAHHIHDAQDDRELRREEGPLARALLRHVKVRGVLAHQLAAAGRLWPTKVRCLAEQGLIDRSHSTDVCYGRGCTCSGASSVLTSKRSGEAALHFRLLGWAL